MRIAHPILAPKKEYRLLAKMTGMLVVIGATKADLNSTKTEPLAGTGKCPVCGESAWKDKGGWTECQGCFDFAVDTKNLQAALAGTTYAQGTYA